jgi:type VI secretion system protein ImpF
MNARSLPASHAVSLPSVLDRLLDDSARKLEHNTSLFFNLGDFKAALARDLEALLNTRVIDPEELFEQYPLASVSVLRYGIPDLSSLSLLNPDDREALRREVQYAITRFEPRLSRVKVTLNTPGRPDHYPERMLHFRVDAVLMVHPRHPPVSFDATLQLSSTVYQVREHA